MLGDMGIMGRVRGPARAAVAVGLVIMGGLPAFSAAFDPTVESDGCQEEQLHVSLFEGEPTDHLLVGWLCAAGAHDGQTVIIASPPGLAHHAYWDWPVDKADYSFVENMMPHGYAVFNYDRIGTGRSDRPNAAAVTLESEAYVIHQLVGALRAGDIGGTEFEKVVLLGNSLGTLISIFEVERYQDVDGLINTGIIVGPRPTGLAKLFAAFYPAELDPKFQGQGIPPGYATTQPGSRDILFHLPAADPAVVALEEALKDTATAGEAVTFGIWTPFTRTVQVPVLSFLGDRDFLFCDPACEENGLEVTREPLFWGPETCFELRLMPDTGHVVQLHQDSASAFHAGTLDWLARFIGTDATTPPTTPCAA